MNTTPESIQELSTTTQLDRSITPHIILYVEDNPANLILVEGIIECRPDIELLTAKDGIAGISIARTQQPDIILMDINLPGMSGVSALKILREDPLTAHIPVVAVSANAIPADIKKGLDAGFFCYLTKPFKINELMATIALALTSATENSPNSVN